MNFRVEKNVMVPMRDGVELATDLWVPDEAPAATLLVRLPYSKDLFPAAEVDYPTMPNIFSLLEAGYAIAFQDCRGTGRSDGSLVPIANEAQDGFDTIAWLRDQPWCDGRIGMFGHSYLGMTQWAATSLAPEGLSAIAPAISASDMYRGFWYSPGGALSWHAIWYWSNLMLMLPVNNVLAAPGGPDAIVDAAVANLSEAEDRIWHLPISDQPLFKKVWSWWDDILQHTERNQYWVEQSAIEQVSAITTPALHIAGWFDIFVGDTLRTYKAVREEGATEQARTGQRLIIGPWDHMHFTGEYHDRNFGPGSSLPAVDLTGSYINFFDKHVRGLAADTEPPVRIFVMGLDDWRDEEEWPLPDTQYTDYYMAAATGASSEPTAGGGLSTEVPRAGESVFSYDPRDPVPSRGGRLMLPASLNEVGPVDQSDLEARPDVLVFSTDVLDEPLEVTGHVQARLWVSSSAVDTDFTAKLVDVHPDGRAIYLTDGITRMRLRNSVTEPELIEPGQIYEVLIDMSVTSNVFRPGHRIRLEISSSNFPRYDRNLNTGERNSDASEALVATNRVLHGARFHSHLVLPIVPPRNARAHSERESNAAMR